MKQQSETQVTVSKLIVMSVPKINLRLFCYTKSLIRLLCQAQRDKSIMKVKEMQYTT